VGSPEEGRLSNVKRLVAPAPHFSLISIPYSFLAVLVDFALFFAAFLARFFASDYRLPC